MECVGSMLFCEGLCNLARTRKLLRLLLHRKATIAADLNMFCQRWDAVKMMKCLRMMDEMERRLGLYVSMNGTRSDLFWWWWWACLGEIGSFGVMFFARVICCRWKCRLFMKGYHDFARVLSGADIQKSRSSGIVMLAGTYGILDKNWLGIT